jgi:hypothetical protein
MLRNEPLCVTGLLNKAIVHVIEPLLPPKVAMYLVEQFWKGSSSSSSKHINKHNNDKKVVRQQELQRQQQQQQPQIDELDEEDVEVLVDQ